MKDFGSIQQVKVALKGHMKRTNDDSVPDLSIKQLLRHCEVHEPQIWRIVRREHVHTFQKHFFSGSFQKWTLCIYQGSTNMGMYPKSWLFFFPTQYTAPKMISSMI